MSVYKIGDIMRRTREELGITQESLCYGICAVSTLSKIENGAQMPSRNTFEALMQRMGKTGDMYTSFVSEKEYLNSEMKYKIQLHLSDGKFEEASILLDEFEKVFDLNDKLNRQFVTHSRAGILFGTSKEYEKIKELFEQAITITIPDFNIKQLYRFYLSSDEISIINSIAVIHDLLDNRRKAIEMLYSLKEYMDEKHVSLVEKAKTYPMILYNLSKWLGRERRYEESIEISDIGQNACIEYGKMRLLPNIIFNKAWCLNKLGQQEDSKPFLRMAYYTFLAMNKEGEANQIKKYMLDNYEEPIV
ncbi:MAG: transcriptional regulator [Herbinix sp.]|nr:transcriptional regulator [Herbinix sp.]